MKDNECKLYYDCDTQELSEIMFRDELYYVTQDIAENEHDIDDCQNAMRAYPKEPMFDKIYLCDDNKVVFRTTATQVLVVATCIN